MSNLLNSKILLGVVAIIAVALVLGLAFTMAMSSASAQQANVSASDIQFAATVGPGSSGQAVIIWQKFLNDYSSANLVADGLYGPLTEASARTWQASQGIAVDGWLGPQSRTAAMAQIGSGPVMGLPAGCTSTTGYSSTTGDPCNVVVPTGFPAGCTSTAGYSPTTGVKCDSGSTLPAGCLPGYMFSSTTGMSCTGGSTPSGDLQGGAGSIDYTLMSEFSNEEVGEDENDVEVLGVDIEPRGSDVELTAVRVAFAKGTADNDFEDYADEVSIWLDGDEVGRVDADEFDDDNSFTSTITLDSGAVVDEDDMAELVVAVSGISNLDSGDATETWTADVTSVRYRDGLNAMISEDPGTATRTFSFEVFATAADIDLKIAETNDPVNTAHLIDVDPTELTDDVVLLDFTLEAEGDSDLDIRELGVDIVVTGAANVDGVVSGGTAPAVYLEIEGNRYGTASYHEDADGASVGVDEEVLFTDVDYTLQAGEKVGAQILVKLNDTTGTGGTDDMDEGDTILAQITSTQTADTVLFNVRDESGTKLTNASDISGSATGEANQVYDEVFEMTTSGWTTTNVQTSDTSGIDESATFELVMDITAVDGDIFIDDAPCIADDANGAAATDGFAWDVINFADFDGGVDPLTTCTVNTTATDAGDGYQVSEGDTETFTLTVNITANDASDFAQVFLNGIGWTGGADGTGDRLFTGDLANDLRSEAIFLNTR